MRRNFLGIGIGAGLALGVAVFSPPASATLVLTLNPTTDVGSVDLFLGACVADGGGLATEIACINRITELNFGVDDAVKMDPIDGLVFLEVDDTDTMDNLDTLDIDEGYDDDYAILLDKLGGWFSVKTGNLSCNLSPTDPGLGDACDPLEKDYYLIFRNLPDSSYGVFDLDALGASSGFVLKNIGQFSHITIVPLPGAALLFGSALLGGGLVRRRKTIKKFGRLAA